MNKLLLLLLASMIGAAAPIEHKQIINPIFDETDFQGWPEGMELKSRFFTQGEASADGSRLTFFVGVAEGNDYHWRLYSCNQYGEHLKDHTSRLPVDYSGPYQINDIGHRLFMLANGRRELHYINLDNNSAHLFVNGLSGASKHKYYSINSMGTAAYMKHNAGYDSGLGRNVQGLFRAREGIGLSQVFDTIQLPCDSDCGSIMNFWKPLGIAGNESRYIFGHTAAYGTPGTSGFWVNKPGGEPVMLFEEGNYVWNVQDVHNKIISGDGRRALYYLGDTEEMWVVDMVTGTKEYLVLSDAFPGGYTSLSKEGDLVIVDAANHRATGVWLEAGETVKRDTYSYYIQPTSNGPGWRTDRVIDEENYNPYYFFTGNDVIDESLVSINKIYRTEFGDEATTGRIITGIDFTKSELVHQDGETIGIEVVTPPTVGAMAVVEWVKVTTLVEGREKPDWPMGRPPLAYPSGDASSHILYDDGTNGDRVAGDGVFSFDKIATRKGGYDDFNSWYNHYTLPAELGIRTIAKTAGGQYAIADTNLLIVEEGGETGDEVEVTYEVVGNVIIIKFSATTGNTYAIEWADDIGGVWTQDMVVTLYGPDREFIWYPIDIDLSENARFYKVTGILDPCSGLPKP